MVFNFDRDFLLDYPEKLCQILATVMSEYQVAMYVAGGSVRDWLMGALPQDLDLTVSRDAFGCARSVARYLGAAFVPLDEKEDVARVVWHDLVIDFSSFRNGTSSITADLEQRDFTINSMAIELDPLSGSLALPRTLIDPVNGLADVNDKIIRAPSEQAFIDDPLRLLRTFRFVAGLGFVISEETLAAIVKHGFRLPQVASERICYEMQLVMQASRSYVAINAMADAGLLKVLFPELFKGKSLAQPTSHHLDVFDHNMETLRCLGDVIVSPEKYFVENGDFFSAYLQNGKRAAWLKWAALFHDVGKPATSKIRDDKITFYNHDHAGAAIFEAIANRLRFSKEDRQQVARFIGLHMWPFHLSNARLKTGITKKACLRLVKAVKDELPGLFLLAMADCLAGQGPGKPEGIEENLAQLFYEVNQVCQEHIKPVLTKPPLLTGHDLKEEFSLTPGPVFKEILDGLQNAQVEHEVVNRDQAIAWVRTFLAE
jgi:poly(A) polymerase